MTSPLISAFPASLTPDVSRLAALLDPPSGLDTSEPFTVTCDGAVIQIPHRIYRPVISESQLQHCIPPSSPSRLAGLHAITTDMFASGFSVPCQRSIHRGSSLTSSRCAASMSSSCCTTFGSVVLCSMLSSLAAGFATTRSFIRGHGAELSATGIATTAPHLSSLTSAASSLPFSTRLLPCSHETGDA